jgi:DNA-binding response OmpR family regulator
VKILVVEDEQRMAQVLPKALEEENHAVSVTGNGSEALELAESSSFDLILLDVMLPGIFYF